MVGFQYHKTQMKHDIHSSKLSTHKKIQTVILQAMGMPQSNIGREENENVSDILNTRVICPTEMLWPPTRPSNKWLRGKKGVERGMEDKGKKILKGI